MRAFGSEMFWGKRLLVVASLAVIVAAGACRGWRRYAESMPSYQLARASVKQIVFVRGRVLVRNEISDVFASDDDGRSWRGLSGQPPRFAVANGTELWAAFGWPGIHEGPSASIWRSTDRGETWSKADIALADRLSPMLHGQLPAAYINEPGGVPLLIMSDSQLVHPELATDSSTWKRIGRPIPDLRPSPGTVNPTVAGRSHGGALYVASEGHIFMSNDGALTWAEARTHRFIDAQIQCEKSTCYALLTERGSEWNGLMSTESGSNDWKSVSTFNVSALVEALSGDRWRGKVETFGACAMIATSDGIYVAGIVNAGDKPWGAVLRLDREGRMTSVGRGVPVGLWVLERSPDGTLWAGGRGAYRLVRGEWVSAWSEPE